MSSAENFTQNDMAIFISYLYQPETPISARGPSAPALGLIWVSRIDLGYGMKIAIYM